jgi:hypothetical protein
MTTPTPIDASNRETLSTIKGAASGILSREEQQKLDHLSGGMLGWGMVLANEETGESWVFMDDQTDDWVGWVELATLRKGIARVDSPDDYQVFWEYLDTVGVEETLDEDDLEDIQVYSWLSGLRLDLDDRDAEELAGRILFDIENAEDDDEDDD